MRTFSQIAWSTRPYPRMLAKKVSFRRGLLKQKIALKFEVFESRIG